MGVKNAFSKSIWDLGASEDFDYAEIAAQSHLMLWGGVSRVAFKVFKSCPHAADCCEAPENVFMDLERLRLNFLLRMIKLSFVCRTWILQ